MNSYIIYELFGRLHQFDPVTDLLATNQVFFTWREVDQIAPPGKPLACVYVGRRDNWCIQPYRQDDYHIFPALGAWLNAQKVNPSSLGPWCSSNYCGLFSPTLTNEVGGVREKLLAYNALMSGDEYDIVSGFDRYTSGGPLMIDCLSNQVVGVRMHGYPVQFWSEAREQLIRHYRQVQDQRLGLMA